MWLILRSNCYFQNGPGVARKKLIEVALENCDVYRYEYILNKPTQNLENMLEIAVDELVMQSKLATAEVGKKRVKRNKPKFS